MRLRGSEAIQLWQRPVKLRRLVASDVDMTPLAVLNSLQLPAVWFHATSTEEAPQ